MAEFPLEKILNVTATEYCVSVRKELSDYELVGVHASVGYKEQEVINKFRNSVPHDAEVVVNYSPIYAVTEGVWSSHKIETADGTALVPKK